MLSNDYKLPTLSALSLCEAIERHFQLTIESSYFSGDIHSFTANSGECLPGVCFIALPGVNSHGKVYIPDAIHRGASTILVEDSSDYISFEEDVLIIHLSNLDKKIAALFLDLYASYFEQLSIVAVTGTNGKTSVANLCAQISALSGRPGASIGTLGVLFFDKSNVKHFLEETKNTTPDAVTLMNQCIKLASLGVQLVCIEASSHGIEQGRLIGVPIQSVAFTNLTQDHLDYHGDMQTYALAKRKILENPSVKHVILNASDRESSNWQKASNNKNIIWFSSQHPDTEFTPQFRATDIRFQHDGIRFSLTYHSSKIELRVPLVGAFNVDNTLAALALVNTIFPLTQEQIVHACGTIDGVDGRMEISEVNGRGVLVDYAHTPDALEKALQAARSHTSGNIIVVFGCGGDRDSTKRPLMGKVAETFANYLVITEDNPRSESQDSISKDILAGLSSTDCVFVINDRQEAIRKALQISQPSDILLLAGKGHETYIERNNQKVFYDERAFVKSLSKEFA